MDLNEQIKRIFKNIKLSKNPMKLLDDACDQVIQLVNQSNSSWMEDFMDQMEPFTVDENLLDKE